MFSEFDKADITCEPGFNEIIVPIAILFFNTGANDIGECIAIQHIVVKQSNAFVGPAIIYCNIGRVRMQKCLVCDDRV